jgi:excisionase family DNA binding protein
MNNCRPTLPTNPSSATDTPEASERAQILALLQALHIRLDDIENKMALSREKETYTVEEAAKRLNRTPWTVRQWCNKGQLEGAKKVHGMGRTGEWRIPHDALIRAQNQGPLPLTRGN